MKRRLFLSALFRLRNIGILLIALGVAYIVSGYLYGARIILYPAAVVVYLVSVFQSLGSKKFLQDFKRKQKIRQIQDLNYKCLKLSSTAQKYANNTYQQKLGRVIGDKDEIVNSFFRGERSYLKEKIVEQTLNLVVSYLKLLINFCIRNRELSSVNMDEITSRINLNTRKLGFAKDMGTLDDINRVIEMDEKLLNRIRDEKRDLERVAAKLDYMESTVNMFKHQIIASVESEEMLDKLETAINEAAALDNVLEERRRSKVDFRQPS
jgi:hypothetical protein